ncbi:MAG: squalene/phytoene synthase family protein [Gammaproteobacteria bacterium]|nr:squalene/phytoene synthase family protein [Gammaproteobacteria bacterium]
MEPEEICRGTAAPAGSNFYYGTLFQPPAGRRALFALFALLSEVAAALRDTHDRTVGELRLAWWMDEMGRLPSAASNHPVGVEIGELLRARPGLAAELRAFISAAAALQNNDPPETHDQWIDQLAGVHGLIWASAARHVAGADDSSAGCAARIGALLAALEDVQHLPVGLRTGRCVLPAQELARHGLSIADIGQAAAQDRLVSCLGETLTRLRDGLLQAERDLAARANGSLLFAGVMARLGAALCMELAEDRPLLLQRRTALTPIRKLWIAWRTQFSWRKPGR